MGSRYLPNSGLYILLATIAIIFILGVGSSTAQMHPLGTTYYIGDTTAGDDFNSIQDAIDSASAGDTLIVTSRYDPANDPNGITIDKAVTIQGENPDIVIGPASPTIPVTIGSDDYVVQIYITADGVTLRDITIEFYMGLDPTIALLIDANDVTLDTVTIVPADTDQYPKAFIVPMGSGFTISDVTLEGSFSPTAGDKAGPSPLAPPAWATVAVWVPSTTTYTTFSGFTITGNWDFVFYIEGDHNTFISNTITLTDAVYLGHAPVVFYDISAGYNTFGSSGSPNVITMDLSSATAAPAAIAFSVIDFDNVQYNTITVVPAGGLTYNGINIYGCGVSVAYNTIYSSSYYANLVGIATVGISCPLAPVTITDNTIYNAGNGIQILDSEYVTISNNILHDNSVGIVTATSAASTNHISIVGNNIYSNLEGIEMDDTTDSSIDSNTFTDNIYAIILDSTSSSVTVGAGNIITATTLTPGTSGIWDAGTNNVIQGTATNPITISNYDIGIYTDPAATGSQYSFVDISNVNTGIMVDGSSTLTFSNILINGFNNYGFQLLNGATAITIIDSEVENGGTAGIYLDAVTSCNIGQPSHGNVIHDISAGTGIMFASATSPYNSNVDANEIYNVDVGIDIGGDGVTVGSNAGNTIRDFGTYGISISGNSNTVVGNTIYQTTASNIGILLTSTATGNTIGSSSSPNVLYNLDIGIQIEGSAAGNVVQYNDIGYSFGGVDVGISILSGSSTSPNDVSYNQIVAVTDGIMDSATADNNIHDNTISCAYGISLISAQNQAVYNNQITGFTTFGIRIVGSIAVSSSSNSVHDNIITGTGTSTAGIYISDATSNSIYNNQISMVVDGILISDHTIGWPLTVNNDIYNNQITDASEAGIKIDGPNAGANNVYGNQITLSTLTTATSGIFLIGTDTGNVIGTTTSGNIIHGAFEYGIYAEDAKDVTIQNNDIDVTPYGTGGIGILMTGSNSYGAIDGNTILAYYGITLVSGGYSDGTAVTNNIIGSASSPTNLGIDVNGYSYVDVGQSGSGNTVYADTTGIRVYGTSSDVTVEDNIVSCTIGIEVNGVEADVMGNTVTADNIGIYYHDVSLTAAHYINSNTVSGISPSATDKVGIYIKSVTGSSGSGLHLQGNTISLASLITDSEGIMIESSQYIMTDGSLNQITNFDKGVLVVSSSTQITLQQLNILSGTIGIDIGGTTSYITIGDNVELDTLTYGIYINDGANHISINPTSIGTGGTYIHDVSTGIYGTGTLDYVSITNAYFSGSISEGIYLQNVVPSSSAAQLTITSIGVDSSGVGTGIKIENSQYILITDTSPPTGYIGTSTAMVTYGIRILDSTDVTVEHVLIYASNTGIDITNTALPGSSQDVQIQGVQVYGAASATGIGIVMGRGVIVTASATTSTTIGDSNVLQYAIYIEDSQEINVQGTSALNNIINYANYGVYVTGTSSSILITYTQFTDHQQAGVYLDAGVTDVTVSNSAFRVTSLLGASMKGVQIHGASSVTVDTITFGNPVSGIANNYGVYIDNGATDVTVRYSSFSASAAPFKIVYGIYVTGNSELLAYGNAFTGIMYGIYVENNVLSAFNVVLGDSAATNTFDGCEYGIYVMNSQYVAITYEDFGPTTAPTVGIYIESSSYITIDHSVFNVLDYGIEMTGSTDQVDVTLINFVSAYNGFYMHDITTPASNIYIHDINSAGTYEIKGTDYGIYMDNVAGTSYGIHVYNVLFHDNAMYDIYAAGSTYIDLDTLTFTAGATIPGTSVWIPNSDYVKLHDSTFNEGVTTGPTVLISGGSSYIDIYNNAFTGTTTGTMIQISGSSYVAIYSNTFSGGATTAPLYAIYVSGSSSNIEIHDNTVNAAASPMADVIYVANSNNGEIYSNTINTGSFTNIAIWIDTGSSDFDVYDNTVHGSSGTGIYVNSASNIDVYRNELQDLDYGVVVIGSYDITVAGNEYRNGMTGDNALYITSSYNVHVTDHSGAWEFYYASWENAILVDSSHDVEIDHAEFFEDLTTDAHALIKITSSYNVHIHNNLFNLQSGNQRDIKIASSSYSIEVDNNQFHGAKKGVVARDDVYDILIHDNLFDGPYTDEGVWIYSLSSAHTEAIKVYDNTFSSASIPTGAVAIRAEDTGLVPVEIYGNAITLGNTGTHAIDVLDTSSSGGTNAVQVYDNTITTTGSPLANTIGVYVNGAAAEALLHAYSTGTVTFSNLIFAFYVTGDAVATIENHPSGGIVANQYGLKVTSLTGGYVVFQNNYVQGYGAGSNGALIESSGSVSGGVYVHVLNSHFSNVYEGIQVTSASENVLIQGNDVAAINADVSVTGGSHDVNIYSNVLDATYGIYLNGVSGVTISDNDIYDNTYGIYIEDSSDITIDDSIAPNDIYDNDNGIFMTGTVSDITISGNNIYDNTYGIKFDTATVGGTISINANNLYFTVTPSVSSYLIYMDDTSSGSLVTITGNILEDRSMPSSPDFTFGLYASQTGIQFTMSGGQVKYLKYGAYLIGPYPVSESITGVEFGPGNFMGLYLNGALLTIQSNNIHDNMYGAFVDEAGFVESFSGNIFDTNDYGLYVYQDGGVLSGGNTFTGNDYGVYLYQANSMTIMDTIFSSDGTTASIYVYDSDDVIVGNSATPNTFTNGLNDGVFVTGSDNVLVQYNQFTTMAGTAINVTASSAPTITRNVGTGLNVGVHVWGGVDYATITYNMLSGASTYGILVQGVSTPRTTVSYNTISDFNYGICVTDSSHVDVSYNTVYDNDCGLCVRDSSDVILEWNTLYSNTNSFCLSGTLSDIIIRYNDIYGSYCGIYVHDVHGGLTIAANKIHDNTYGICIEASSEIQIIQHRPDLTGNWGIYDNTEAGIHIYDGSEDIFVNDNWIYGTSAGTYGVYIEDSNNNNVSENKIYDFSDAYAAYVLSGSSNEFWNNEIYSVTTGIYSNGPSTTIKGNYIHDGVGSYGIYLDASADGSVIVYNTISGYSYGIYGLGTNTDSLDNVIMAYNTITDATDGIYVRFATSISISDNVAQASTRAVYILQASLIEIRDNELSGTATYAKGIYIDTSNNVTIANNRISNTYSGVYLEIAEDIIIDGNEIYNSYKGIIADLTYPAGTSPGLSITNNNIHDIEQYAIDAEEIFSGTVTITNNNINGAQTGIYLDGCGSTLLIQGNSIANVDYGIFGAPGVYNSATTIASNNIQSVNYDAINLHQYFDVTITSNVISDVDSKAIYLHSTFDRGTATINDNTITNADYGIYVENEDTTTIFSNTIETIDDTAIYLEDTPSFIYSNQIEDYYTGIYVEGGSSEIHENTIINGVDYAIYGTDVYDILVYGNTITYATWGIYLESCDAAEVYSNTLTDIYDYGIYLFDSDDSLVHDNTIAEGSYYTPEDGIYVDESDDVEVYSNVITGAWIGIEVDTSSGTTIYWNTFSGCDDGIYVTDSDDFDIYENTITPAEYGTGIDVEYSYPGNIYDNTINGAIGSDQEGIYVSEADDVINVFGNVITADYGIYLDFNYWDVYVYENDITALYGIYVFASWYPHIYDNTVEGTDGSAVGIESYGLNGWYDVFYADIYGNQISGFTYGIVLENYTDYSDVYENIISDVEYGITLWSWSSDASRYTDIYDNTISAGAVGIYVNSTATSLHSEISGNNISAPEGVVIEGAKYVDVLENTIEAAYGVEVLSWFDGSTWYYANDANVSANIVNASMIGILLFDSWYSDVWQNTVNVPDGIGIELEYVARSDIGLNTVNASSGIISFDGMDNDIVNNVVTATGSTTGIASIREEDVNIDGNTVTGFEYGIYVSEGVGIDVTHNTVSGGTYGIYDVSAQAEDAIMGNTVADAYYGIYVESPIGYANVTENSVSGAYLGIYMHNAVANLISGNTITDSEYGIEVEVNDGTEIAGNAITVTDTGIVIMNSNGIQAHDNTVNSANYGIMLYSSTYNYVEDNDVTATNVGIFAFSDEGSWIQYNDVSAGIGIMVSSSTITEVYHNDVSGTTGIVVLDSDHIHVRLNDVTATYMGIHVYGVSEFLLIEDNDVASDAYGIVLDGSMSTTVTGNDVSGDLAGIYMYEDLNSEVTDNDITGSVYGVQIEGGAYQYIAENTITSDYIGVEISAGYSVTVYDNSITAAFAGVHLADDTVLTDVQGNTVSSMYYGVHVEASGNNTISNNTIDATVGVEIENSPYILVQNNSISGGFVYKGIEVVGSTYIEIYDNTVNQATYGIIVKGQREARLSYIDIEGNTVSYASLYGIYVKYTDFVYVTDNSVSYSMYGIVIKRSTLVMISGDATYMNRIGHYILFSSEVRITNVFAQNDDNGFFIERSTYVRVDNSTFYRDVFAGVVSDSTEFRIENNTVVECIYGIVIRGSQEAEVKDNEVSQTVYIGVWIDKSSAIDFHDNYVHDSYISNLKAEESTGLNIAHNTFVNSTNNLVFIDVQSSEIHHNQIEGAMEYGLKLVDSSGNQIYLNNFVNNNRLGYHEAQAFDNGVNTYYTMVLVGDHYYYYGNYWSDHTSPDDNGDGIVDTPYAIEGGSNEDPYPLVAPISL